MANERNRIPTTLIDYAVYLGMSRLIGTADITLPSVSALTSEVSGAGIGGTVEIPILGKFESMQLTIGWRTIEMAAAELMRPVAHDLVLRACQQIYDGAGGDIKSEGAVYYCRVIGPAKGFELGNMKAGESMERKTEMELIRIRETRADLETFEIDKLNGIFRVLGIDYSASVRADLGI